MVDEQGLPEDEQRECQPKKPCLPARIQYQLSAPLIDQRQLLDSVGERSRVVADAESLWSKGTIRMDNYFDDTRPVRRHIIPPDLLLDTKCGVFDDSFVQDSIPYTNPQRHKACIDRRVPFEEQVLIASPVAI